MAKLNRKEKDIEGFNLQNPINHGNCDFHCTFIDLPFRHQKDFILVLISSLVALSTNILSWGLAFTSLNIDRNTHINFIYTASGEIPALFLFSYCANRSGQKKMFTLFSVMMSVLLLILAGLYFTNNKFKEMQVPVYVCNGNAGESFYCNSFPTTVFVDV